MFLGGMVDHLLGRPPGKLYSAQPSFHIQIAVWFVMCNFACDIGEDNNRKFETLRSMHTHHTHAFRAFLVDHCLRLLALLGCLKQFFDKATERHRTSTLVLSSKLGDVQDVCQCLLASRTHYEARVRPSRAQELV